jgi:hypothetical protein
MDPSKSRATMYDVSWNAYDLGGLDNVDPQFDLLLRAIKMGSFGPVKLGDRFLGLDDGAKVIVDIRETVRGTFQKLAPWANQSAGNELDLTPPANTDLYTYAQSLILHPRDRTGQTPSTDQDLELYKTVPVNWFKLKRTGNDEDVYSVTFLIYPDRAQLPLLKYGRMKS